MRIEIDVAGKIATVKEGAKIVCGNSDYEIAFNFDGDWSNFDAKTARFLYQKHGQTLHQEVIFSGNICPVPVLTDILEVSIGVYAGDLSTSTPAVVDCERSILCSNPVHDEPPKDIYNQLMGMYQTATDAAENAEKSAQRAVQMLGDIKTALDNIIAIQEELKGGDA